MMKSSLSKPHQKLIEQCGQIHFGRITLFVRSGKPDLDRPWRTRQTVKLAGGESGSKPPRSDFLLCKEQLALLTQLAHVSDEACVSVEVRHGLPFLIEIEQVHQAA